MGSSKAKLAKKKLRLFYTLLWSKSLEIWDHFFPLLFPKDSENLKSLDIGLWEVGAKRRLNKVNKWRRKNHKNLFLPRQFHTLYEKKFSNMRPLLSITQGFRKSKKFAHWTLWSGGKSPLKGKRNTNTKQILLSKAKFAQKQTFFVRRFYTHYL